MRSPLFSPPSPLGKQTEIVSCQFFREQQQQQKVRTILNTKCQRLVSPYLDILMNTCLSIHLQYIE